MAGASSSGYSWERPDQQWRFGPPVPMDPDADSSDPDEEPSPQEAGEYLVSFLLELMYTNALSARSLCVICYWAARAGASGPVADYGLKPNSPSGHFQRKVDSVTGVNLRQASKQMFKIRVPQHSKYDLSRTTHEMVVQLPHEEFANEVAEDPSAASGPFDPEWTAAYREHPTVTSNPGATVMPYAFYLDGISFTRTDTLLGIFVYSLHTLKRHLCCVLRRSNFCKCGCKGWCTLYPVFAMLRWSFECLSNGVWPSSGPAGDWADDDVERSNRGGTPLGFRGALLHIKGDWAEFAHTLGFADWNSELFCCLFCKATKANRFDIAGVSPFGSVWGALAQDDMDRACLACEKWVTLSREQHGVVKARLHYNRKKGGGSGRCLFVDIAELGLDMNDRLEPHSGLPDVALFDSITEFPCRVLFWRSTFETRCRHRNPMFGADIGVTINTLMVDKLHTLHLGPAQFWASHCLWELIKTDAWDTRAVGKDLHSLSVQHIKSSLWTWYSDQRRLRPDTDITEVQNFTLAMMGGTPSTRSLHTKAAETKGLVPFVLHLLRTKFGSFAPDSSIEALIDAGAALQTYFELLESEPRNVSAAGLQAMFDAVKQHIALSKLAGIDMKPKHHLMIHLVSRTAEHGNPGYYATFTDEGINHLLKKVGQAAHRSVWEVRVFMHFDKVEEARHGKKRHLSNEG
jgi:hypothetical protein